MVRRVLTMDRLDGVPLTDLEAIRSMTTANPERVLINALNTWSGSLLACHHFHADVHAGTAVGHALLTRTKVASGICHAKLACL